MCSMKGCRYREALSGRSEDCRPTRWTMAKDEHTADDFPRTVDVGATPWSTDQNAAPGKASTRVFCGQAAIGRVLCGEVVPGTRRKTRAAVTGYPSPSQSDWNFAPKAVSSHWSPHTRHGHVCNPPEPKGHLSSACCRGTGQTYSVSRSKTPAFINTRDKYLIDGFGNCVHCLERNLQERKLDARHFGCPNNPVPNPKGSLPEYSTTHRRYNNEITDIRSWSDKVKSNFSYEKKVKDKDIIVENKIDTMLEKLKYLKTVFSSHADQINPKKNVTSKTSIPSPENRMDQLGDKLEFSPRNRKNSFQVNGVSASGKHNNDRKNENNNTDNFCKDHEEIFFSNEPDKYNGNRIFRREDDIDFELPVKLEAENYRDPNVDYTETVSCARNYNSNVHHMEPPAVCSSLGCSDTDIGGTAHPAVNKEESDTVERSKSDSKPSGTLNDLAAKKHGSTATCEQSKIKPINKVKQQHEAMHHHPLTEATNCQKWKQRTTGKMNTHDASASDAISRTYCGLLCSKATVTTRMVLDESLAMEMSTLLTKIRKLLSHKNSRTFSMKNVNLTEKYFKTFMTKRKKRFMSDSINASSGNRSASEQFAKLNCPEICKFVPKVLQNERDDFLAGMCEVKSGNISPEYTVLTTVQTMGQCAKILSDLDSVSGKMDECKPIRFSESDINTGKVSNAIVEKENFLTQSNFKANKICSVRLGRDFRRKSSKTPEETRCLDTENKIYVLHLRKENCDILRQYDGKSRIILMKDVSNTGGSRFIRIAVKHIDDNMSNKSLSFNRYIPPCKPQRYYHPQQDVADILTIPRKHFGMRPSQFFRLFYLCTLKEALSYDTANNRDCLFSRNKQPVKRDSQAGLHSKLRLLPDEWRLDSQFPHSLVGQKKSATVERVQLVELTTAVSCSGQDGQEQHSLGSPLRDDNSPGVAESLWLPDSISKCSKSPNGRHDSLSKSDKGKMSSPCEVQESEKSFAERNLETSGNKLYPVKGKAETKPEAPSQRNEDVVDQPADCIVLAEQCDRENQVSLCRNILEQCLEEACLRNYRNERTSAWQTLNEAAGTCCQSSDNVMMARPPEQLLSSDDVIFPETDKNLESSSETSKFIVDIVLNRLEGRFACRNITENLNGIPIQDTINFKDLEGETETMLLGTVIGKPRTQLMLVDGSEHEINTLIPANSTEGGSGSEHETNTLIPANSNEGGSGVDCGQISCTAHEVIHGLLLQILSGICAGEHTVSVADTDHATTEAAGRARDDVETVEVGGESDDQKGEERRGGRGVVKRMLELYSKGRVTAVTSQLKTELGPRSSEIGNVPAGVVRERREMFAKMSTFDSCSGPEARVVQKSSTLPFKLTDHAPAAEQPDQATIVRDASETEEAETSASVSFPDALGTAAPVEYSPPRCTVWLLIYSMERPPPYDTDTLRLKRLVLLLFLCFVFGTSCHVLGDHSHDFA